MQPDQPYNTLPDLPPRQELETRAVLKACVSARSELARLNESSRQLPNANVLINTLPFLEAQASSEIENIVTTTDALFRHASARDDRADPATKEALRYRTALKAGFDALAQRPLCTTTAVEICRTIKNQAVDIRAVPGTALANDQTGEVIYTPPVGQDLLRQKLGNWERFVHEAEDLDPVVRMAVAHYQFEAIHPFADGNGRTGRILNLLILHQLGLLDLPILYLSSYILRNKADYYRLLLEVTRNEAWEEWTLFMLEGVRETAQWTCEKIHAIRALMKHTRDYLKVANPQVYTRELADLIFVQPYCRIQNLVDAGIAKRQTASQYLHELCRLDILSEVQMGREKLFVHPRLVKLLFTNSNAVAVFPELS